MCGKKIANPVMNIKLMMKTVEGEKKMISHITDKNGRKINHLDLVKKYGTAQCVIKFDGLFIGKTVISCQLKLLEAVIEPTSGSRRLLFAPRFVDNDHHNSTGTDHDDDDDDFNDGIGGDKPGIQDQSNIGNMGFSWNYVSV